MYNWSNLDKEYEGFDGVDLDKVYNSLKDKPEDSIVRSIQSHKFALTSYNNKIINKGDIVVIIYGRSLRTVEVVDVNYNFSMIPFKVKGITSTKPYKNNFAGNTIVTI